VTLVDELSIWLMASAARPTTWLERSATVRLSITAALASLAPSAVRLTLALTSPRAAAVSARLAAWRSVRADRSSIAPLISPAPARRPPAPSITSPSAASSPAIARLKSPRRPS